MLESVDRYSPKVVMELKHQRFDHPTPRVRLLIVMVYYYAKGWSLSQIVAIEPLPESLLEAIIQTYEKDGIQGLEDSTFLSDQDGRETL